MSGTTYPLATLAATVTTTGISAPSFTDILNSLIASYQAIYGSDVVTDPSSQDYQWLSIQAAAINDSNAMAIAVYNQFSPATAQGTGLSSVVKINGIARLVSSNSSADVLLVGQVGQSIFNGVVGDDQGLNTRWLLPATVTFPPAGEITVTATCTTQGAVTAAAGTLNQILTPTAGWQTVTNPANASPGAPVETDAQLRRRQAVSTQLPAETVLGGIVGNILNLPGVTQVQAYENDTDVTDGNGLPDHSICLSVIGGDLQSIVNIIGSQKTIGCNTYGGGVGSVSGTYTDPISGIPYTIFYNVPTEVTVQAVVNISPLSGYTASIGQEIVAAVAAAINASTIGNRVQYTRLYGPSYLSGPYAAPALSTDGQTYEVNSVSVCALGGVPAEADVPIAFNQVAISGPAFVTVTA